MFCQQTGQQQQQQQRWEQPQQQIHIQCRGSDCGRDGCDEGDGANPAGDTDTTAPSPLSLDEQIKAYEALRAEHARQLELMEQYRQQELLLQQQQQQQLILESNNTDNSNSITARRRRKRVAFAEDALLYGSDRTEEDVERMWYNKAELAVFKEERKNIVKVLKKSNFNLVAIEASGLYCLRGYEPYFSMAVNRAMKYARTLVSGQVLTEQGRQRSCGYDCGESIRQASSAASQWARDNALQLGKNDEIEAFCYYQDDDDEEEERRLLQQQQQDQLAAWQQDQEMHLVLEPEPFHPHHQHDPEDTSAAYPQDFAYENCFPSTEGKVAYPDDSSLQQLPCQETSMDTDCSPVEQQQQQPSGEPQQQEDDAMQEDDPLAERLDSALKLVQALKFGLAR
jgi:hypothetical protein